MPRQPEYSYLKNQSYSNYDDLAKEVKDMGGDVLVIIFTPNRTPFAYAANKNEYNQALNKVARSGHDLSSFMFAAGRLSKN